MPQLSCNADRKRLEFSAARECDYWNPLYYVRANWC